MKYLGRVLKGSIEQDTEKEGLFRKGGIIQKRRDYLKKEGLFRKGGNIWKRREYLEKEGLFRKGGNIWKRKEYVCSEHIKLEIRFKEN